VAAVRATCRSGDGLRVTSDHAAGRLAHRGTARSWWWSGLVSFSEESNGLGNSLCSALRAAAGRFDPPRVALAVELGQGVEELSRCRVVLQGGGKVGGQVVAPTDSFRASVTRCLRPNAYLGTGRAHGGPGRHLRPSVVMTSRPRSRPWLGQEGAAGAGRSGHVGAGGVRPGERGRVHDCRRPGRAGAGVAADGREAGVRRQAGVHGHASRPRRGSR
jgi:hypothetical protein